jgi:type II secretory ATPase GspE/PulE/Tfp pilus assembly ATPase PilB-like protein
MMKLEPAMLKQMVRAVVATRPDELTCGECFEELDRFVEMTLAEKNAAEAMPLVEDHLRRCRDCREEFEALLVALRALAGEEWVE